MADHEPLQEIEYEGLPGGSLASNLVAGAFAGIMVHISFMPDLTGILSGTDEYLSTLRNMLLCILWMP